MPCAKVNAKIGYDTTVTSTPQVVETVNVITGCNKAISTVTNGVTVNKPATYKVSGYYTVTPSTTAGTVTVSDGATIITSSVPVLETAGALSTVTVPFEPYFICVTTPKTLYLNISSDATFTSIVTYIEEV